MLRFRDHYNWVVLGDHPGALLSASLAARLGLSVLVLPLAPGMRAGLSDSGQCFDPESNYLIGLRGLVHSNGLLSECLQRAGVLSSEEQFIRKDGVLPQVITPSSRVLFALNDQDLAIEYNREFGKRTVERSGFLEALKEAESEFLKYWLALPARLTWDSATAGKSIKKGSPQAFGSLLKKIQMESRLNGKLKKSWFFRRSTLSDLAHLTGRPDFNELFRGLWFGAASNSCADPLLADLVHLLSIARTGASFKGGMTAYREFLGRVAKRLGVHLPEKVECSRLFIQKGQFIGVQVSNHGTMISVDGGVLGCRLDQARDKMTSSGQSWLRKLKRSPRPAGWKFSVALTVHAEAIPPGMSSRVVWQEKDAPALEIEVADPLDYGIKEADSRMIHLRTVLPFKPETLEVGYQRLIATRMLRQLMEIIPFLEYHVTRIYPDFRSVESSRIAPAAVASKSECELSSVYRFKQLQDLPGNLFCFNEKGICSQSGIEGLFVASDESYPELGSLGPTVAALESVAWLAHRSGLPGPLS
ncbi:MAG: hypothetical protein A2428_11845 [Bdellovibrionales bacterium RIFOXYC1_FULL_54_43]|nr:MAG: hypothetical protein A2428_11845 [Bdellovibrionales bacterium RIFOXYC1_FULL_54_43]OFZ84984.1 MAG: hypothetical protein A2603_04160 [Bdellovibrionales bacterium RIFOXYD1_FULL_55_31]